MGIAFRLLIAASKITILLTQGHWRQPCLMRLLMRLPRDSHTVSDDFRSARPPRGYCVPPETVLDTGDQPSQDDVTTLWRGVLHEPLVINGR
jgi:hypothetical protein